ncbi:MAG: hypothetical protein KKA32_02940 [Actinobacteria bacterium]|nr:hypothetical protein [Actinomycetota bacterium]
MAACGAECDRPRGLTTGPIPWGTLTAQIDLDLASHEILISASDGRAHRIPLVPAPCVGSVWEQVHAAFDDFGIGLDLWAKPQEVADATPLDTDDIHCEYEPDAARAWFAITTAARNVLENWASGFYGRTDIRFWWGGFDLAATRFNGKRVAPKLDAAYIKRWDQNGEYIGAGFWPGNTGFPNPMFSAYISPEPPGCESAAMPAGVTWSPDMGLWVLPYETACAADDPSALLLDFLDHVYAFSGRAAGWDLESFSYEVPPPSDRKW